MMYRDVIGTKACSVFLLCGPCPGCIYLCPWGTSTEGLYLADRLQIECRKGPCDSFVLDFKPIYEGWDNRPSQGKKDVAKEDAAKQKATNPNLGGMISFSEAAEMLADASIVPAFIRSGAKVVETGWQFCLEVFSTYPEEIGTSSTTCSF